jgi:Tfp pilus assembly protein PilF
MVDQSGIRRRGKETGSTEKENDEPSNDWVEEPAVTEEQAEKPADEAKVEKSEQQKSIAEVNAANGLTLATALQFMNADNFVSAVPVLEKLLEQQPEDSKDPACLHNLAVCFMELGDMPNAEETFWKAANTFEEQLKSDKVTEEQKRSTDIYSTMFGLASVLTKANDNNGCKLLQAEVLLRDILEKSQGRDDMVVMNYQTYVLLAQNYSLQKKWSMAAQAYEITITLGNAFKRPDDEVAFYRQKHLQAEKLAKYQTFVRAILWGVAILMLLVTVWYAFLRDTTQTPAGHATEVAPKVPQGPSGLLGAIFSWLPR